VRLGTVRRKRASSIRVLPGGPPVTIPADIREAIWIRWYFVSGSMLVFGGLIIGAWFAARRDRRDKLMVPIVIALFYMIFGVAAYGYQHNPFWLVFHVQGALLLVPTLGLRGHLLAPHVGGGEDA
jgi:hypothetical protein